MLRFNGGNGLSTEELTAALGPALKKVSDLTFPLVIPHRGAGRNEFPEHNIDAFVTGASRFACVDGGDLRMLKDGTFLDHHDATLGNNTTGAYGSVYNLILTQARQLTTVTPSGFPGAGAAGRPLTDFDEIARRVGGKVVLTPEIKGDNSPLAAGVAGTALAAKIVAKGLTKSVIVGSFYLAELTPCLAAGIECAFFPLGDASQTAAKNSAIAARAAGCNWVALSAGAGTGTTADVPAYVAMGFPHVGVGTLNRQTEWAAWQAAGCDWAFSDSPSYMQGDPTKYRITSDTFANGIAPSGFLPQTNFGGDRGTLQNGRWFPKRYTNGGQTSLLGQFSPVAAPTAFTWGMNVCWDALGSDTSRHADLMITTTDGYASAVSPAVSVNGYIVAIRPAAANQLQVYKVVNGVVTSLGSATGVASVAPPVLSSGLAAGVAITSLPVAAVPANIPSGTKLVLPSVVTATGKPQVVTTTALVTAGATAIPVSSVTPTTAIDTGAALPQALPITVQVTATQVIVTRTDTATVLTITDATSRGGYLHAGLNDNAGSQTGLIVSYCDMSVT